jgi:hypothetical protein
MHLHLVPRIARYCVPNWHLGRWRDVPQPQRIATQRTRCFAGRLRLISALAALPVDLALHICNLLGSCYLLLLLPLLVRPALLRAGLGGMHRPPWG